MKWTSLIVLGSFAALTAVPASAAASGAPPTAKQLVAKLVREGVCNNPAPANARGTIAQCESEDTYTIPTTIEVHAFSTSKAMAKDLDAQMVEDCVGPVTGLPLPSRQYLMGKTWWTYPYRKLETMQLRATLGGRLRTIACPQ